ncbi:hypothetical protein GCM10009623_09120 [Nocardioides aestuarii]|uniref:Uncharacterized protein n=1 Tax=Nocardioides aestuarii TaxID=252231 RepID=A0ABW4TI68_9ACTN
MSSTIYTIGTALGRARDHEVVVSVLVGGHWIDGLVNEVDGHGVVLTGSDSGHHVVRIGDISAVRVHAEQPLDDPEPEPWAPFEAPAPLVKVG